MVDGVLFDKLEFIARKVRKNEKPFGGIQVLVSGDFCQLPPVSERHDGVVIPILFAFEAKSWQRCFDENPTGIPMVYRLTKVFRQKDQGPQSTAQSPTFIAS
jgi:ATP-dependent DNA helicase PIF1